MAVSKRDATFGRWRQRRGRNLPSTAGVVRVRRELLRCVLWGVGSCGVFEAAAMSEMTTRLDPNKKQMRALFDAAVDDMFIWTYHWKTSVEYILQVYSQSIAKRYLLTLVEPPKIPSFSWGASDIFRGFVTLWITFKVARPRRVHLREMDGNHRNSSGKWRHLSELLMFW